MAEKSPMAAYETAPAVFPAEQPAPAPTTRGLAYVQPTQVRRPWRATLRTVFQALVALAALAPLLAATVEEATGYNLEGVPYMVTVLGLSAAVTRVMALPQVEVFLRRFIPFLATTPKKETHHG